MTTPAVEYQFLARKPNSLYRQLFIKHRWIAARTIYARSVGEDAIPPEEIAADYGLPLPAVLEALAYCRSNPPEIGEDYAAEQALAEATGMTDPSYRQHGKPRVLAPEELARLNRL